VILDGHIHIMETGEGRDEFARSLEEAGVAGGIVISLPPKSFAHLGPSPSVEERLDNLLRWAETPGEFYPFFWIDPTEDDAAEQVARAVECGVRGFKVICGSHYPGEPRALEVYRAIAAENKPVLFHSGILWDGQASSKFNRPVEFEPLLDVPGLRFALAHISWPWCDELIAVYGKFLSARVRRPGFTVEMFVDTTPGTPAIYRADALAKLFRVGYDVAGNVMFGSDGLVHGYPVEKVRELLDGDGRIYDELGLDEAAKRMIFAENLRRFVGAGKVES